MTTQVQAAIIAGVVGLLTALVGAVINFLQARRERSKWLVDFKASYSLELYKQRLATYPDVFRIIGRLSHGAEPKVDSSIAGEVASELNNWLYGAGGMCAEAGTRGAVLGLRQRCRTWAKSDKSHHPEDLYKWRNTALKLLRLDIDVVGLEEYNFDNMPSVLDRLNVEIDVMTKNKSKSRRYSNSMRLKSRPRID